MAKSTINLSNARNAKNDEFYTSLADIEKELKWYKDFFKGKTVFCNCDDPLESNFTKYFILNFRHLGLKKLICTFYDINGGSAFAFTYEGQDMNGDDVINTEDIEIIRQTGAYRTILVDDEGFNRDDKENCWKNGIYGSGDFRSKNVIDYLKQADIVVTNPPFSLFREYIAQLMEYNKKFIVIGNMNAITYKEIFPYIKNNQLWLGVNSNKTMEFSMPMSYAKWDRIEKGRKYGKVPAISWFTNVENKNRNEFLQLYKKYDPIKYPKYDNYNAINVNKVCEIPCDYNGVMGVPISFLDKYCPNQFEILGITENADYLKPFYIDGCEKYDRPYINGERMYSRLLIKRVY